MRISCTRPRGESAAHEHPEEPPARRPLGAQTRVADLVDAGEQQHESEHRERECRAREEERPPLALQHRRVRLRPVEDHPPADVAVVAEPEELQPGVHEQRDVEDEHERRGDAADHVRHQLAEHDAPGRLAGDLRRLHEVAALERQGLSAQDARLERPERQPQDEDHRRHPARFEVARDDDQERDRRNDEEDVGQEVDDLVDDAP